MSSSRQSQSRQRKVIFKAKSSSTKNKGTQVWYRTAGKQESKKEKESFNVAATWHDIQKNVYKQCTGAKITNQENRTNQPNENGDINIYSTPTMVFSVIGDSDSFVPRPWPKAVFQTALIEAAKYGGETWILHRGTGDEVSNVVQNAYQNYEDLDFGFESVDLTDSDRHIKLISIAGIKTDTSSLSSKIPTIFRPISGEGEGFLLDFEEFVSKQDVCMFGSELNFNPPVPIVIIVCEGDIQTIAHISKALHRKLPVIIAKGSGKAADLVLDFLDDCSASVLRKKASSAFGIEFDDAKYQKIVEHLEKIENTRELVGVFDLERDDPLMLSNIAGEAIINCWSIRNILQRDSKDVEQIPINQTVYQTFRGNSLAGKRLHNDVIDPDKVLKGFQWRSRPHVFSPKLCNATTLPLYFYLGYQILQEQHLMKQCGHVLLFEALKANRCDYVSVLFDRGVELPNDYLTDLYLETYKRHDCEFGKKNLLHLQWILKQIPEAKYLCQNLKIHMTQNENKNKQQPKKEYGEKYSVELDARAVCRKILQYQDCTKSRKDESTANVLLWAIFVNRKELAEICWLRSKDHLLTGLVCSVILDELSKKASSLREQTFSNELKEHSRIFEQRCINMMDSMYEENTNLAIGLMDTEANIWGIDSSPLTFAYEHFMYDVVAHTCSQKYMSSKWYIVPPDLNNVLKISLSKPTKVLKAPSTKFAINYMMFFVVLVMYSIFVLTSVGNKYYTRTCSQVFEYCVYIWGAGDLIEEFVVCFGCFRCLETKGRSKRSLSSRICRYLDFWNVVDLLSYVFLAMALCFRHFYGDETHSFARNMFAVSLLLMYFRFLEVFLINEMIGPTLIMMKEMLKDLKNVFIIALFVVIGVGIYYHANLWPDHQTILKGNWKNWRIWTIIYYPYWQLYGELNLDHLDGREPSDCSNDTLEWETDTSIERCPRKDVTVPFIAAIYMLLSNLLLVNLVIAKFSYTFERVQTDSGKHWHFQYYTALNDYQRRIPSPLSIFIRFEQLFRWLKGRGSCRNKNAINARNEHNKDKENEEEEEKRKKITTIQKNFQKIIAVRNFKKK